LRIFLSFNSKDEALAEALRAGVRQLEPAAEISLIWYKAASFDHPVGARQ
jgi:hypothetical protein